MNARTPRSEQNTGAATSRVPQATYSYHSSGAVPRAQGHRDGEVRAQSLIGEARDPPPRTQGFTGHCSKAKADQLSLLITTKDHTRGCVVMKRAREGGGKRERSSLPLRSSAHQCHRTWTLVDPAEQNVI